MVIRTWNNRIYIIIKFNIMIYKTIKEIDDLIKKSNELSTSNFNMLFKIWRITFDDYTKTLNENFMMKIKIAELEANQKLTEDATKIQNTTRLREDDSSQEVVLEK